LIIWHAKYGRAVNRLQRLLLKSRSARFLAIRQVTQLNQGKKTPGVDGKAKLNFTERFELEQLLKSEAHRWKHQRLREIPIPKKDGSTRMLKVPTIQDRAWQKLVHYALDAAHEATFHSNSYGFRTGRSAHDAQTAIFHNLNSQAKGKNKLILEMDIAQCFDRIRHNKLMKAIMLPRSPYDGDLIYWSQRNSKLYDGKTAELLRKQNHTCGYCGAKFLSDEKVHLHHIDGNHINWKPKNLLVVHESCHNYIHMSKANNPNISSK
jgi:5-methylcytosine-specific restriction endonuclease McrA